MSLALCEGNPWWQVCHTWPILRKALPCHDVITVRRRNRQWQRRSRGAIPPYLLNRDICIVWHGSYAIILFCGKRTVSMVVTDALVPIWCQRNEWRVRCLCHVSFSTLKLSYLTFRYRIVFVVPETRWYHDNGWWNVPVTWQRCYCGRLSKGLRWPIWLLLRCCSNKEALHVLPHRISGTKQLLEYTLPADVFCW